MMIVGVLAPHAAVCAEVAAAGGRYDDQRCPDCHDRC